MVREFLNLRGHRYWSASNRRHLQQPDILKGFLYPRDTERAQSRYIITVCPKRQLLLIAHRLVEALEAIFKYKAKNAQSSNVGSPAQGFWLIANTLLQRGRPEEDQIVKHINFAAMTGHRASAPKTVVSTQPAGHRSYPIHAGVKEPGRLPNLQERPSKMLKTKHQPQAERHRYSSPGSDTPLIQKRIKGIGLMSPSLTRAPSNMTFPRCRDVIDLDSEAEDH